MNIGSGATPCDRRPTTKRIVLLVVGVIAILLGGLWLLQGLDLVRIQPIFCVAECEPIEGGSPLWAGIGLLVAAAGIAAVYFGLRRR